jgi:hypothetical protein
LIAKMKTNRTKNNQPKNKLRRTYNKLKKRKILSTIKLKYRTLNKTIRMRQRSQKKPKSKSRMTIKVNKLQNDELLF